MGYAHHIQSDRRERKIWLWHQFLGHRNLGYMKHLLPDLSSNMTLYDLKYNTCILDKIYHTSYPLSLNKHTILFVLFHSNVWGPSPISIGFGICSFIIFFNDCTHMTRLYLMKHKDEVLHMFQSFHAMI